MRVNCPSGGMTKRVSALTESCMTAAAAAAVAGTGLGDCLGDEAQATAPRTTALATTARDKIIMKFLPRL
jgi:hypothetical protein